MVGASPSDNPLLNLRSAAPCAVVLMVETPAKRAHRLGWDRRAGSRLWRAFIRRTVAVARASGADLRVFWHGRPTTTTTPGLPRGRAQRGNTFGERVSHAIATTESEGYERIVVVGADVPALTAADVRGAFARLDHHPIVLGPDARGGCYLIGVRAGHAGWVRDVPWNRDADRAAIVERLGTRAVTLLPRRLPDVDSGADLRRAVAARDALVPAPLRALARRVLARSAGGGFDPPSKPRERSPAHRPAAVAAAMRRLQLPPPLKAAA